MKQRLLLILPLSFAMLLGADSLQADSRFVDKDDLISFSVPKGWTLKSESSGMRFRRADEKDRTTILVKPKKRKTKDTLERRREISFRQIKSQQGEVVTDREYEKNGFSVWESEFNIGKASVRSFYLFSERVQVEVKLRSRGQKLFDFLYTGEP